MEHILHLPNLLISSLLIVSLLGLFSVKRYLRSNLLGGRN